MPTGGHFECACVHPQNDNSVDASNLMAGNRKLARKVTVLLKAISLVLWIPYFPTKNVIHDKNRTFSTRVFSCRFFSSRFFWPFKDLKYSIDTQHQNSLFLLVYQIWVSLAKQCISMVWFPNSWFYLSRKKCIVAATLRKVKTNLLREVYLLARCLMLNWSRRHAFIYATKTQNLWVFFYIFWKFSRKNT